MKVGTLEIDLMAQMARLSSDMKQAEQVVGSSMKSIESSVDGAKKALELLGSALAVEYFVDLIKGTIDSINQLEELSKATKLTVEQLSGLKLLGMETGVGVDTLAKGIEKMTVSMGKSPEQFKQLGITATDSIGAFMQLSDIFNQLPDVAQRNALAMKVFGRSWADLAPALSMGSEAIGEVVKKGEALSGMTSQMAEKAHEYKVAMAELETVMARDRVTIVGQMLPGFIDIAKAMGEAADRGGVLTAVWVGLGGAASKTWDAITGGGEAATGIKAMEKEIYTLSEKTLPLLQERLKNARQYQPLDVVAWQNAVNKAEGMIKALQSAIRSANGDFQDQVSRMQNQGKGKPYDSGVQARAAEFIGAGAASPFETEMAKARGLLSVATAALNTQELTLTEAEKHLLELRQKPEWKTFSAARQAEIITAFNAASAEEKLADAHKTSMLFIQEMNKAYADADGAAKSLLPAEKALLDLESSDKWKVMAQVDRDAAIASAEKTAAKQLEQKGIENYTVAFKDMMDAEQAEYHLLNDQKNALDEQIATYGALAGDVSRYQAAQLRANATILDGIPGAEDFADRLRQMADAMEQVAARQDTVKAIQDQISAWKQVGDAAGTFLTDILNRSKSVAQSLHDLWKSFFNDLIKMFAQKYILQLGASLTGNAALGTAAGQVGQGTFAGAVGSSLGNLGSSLVAGYGAGGVGGASSFMAGYAGEFAGPVAQGATAVEGSTLLSSAGEWMAGLGATGWGLIIVAAVAVLSQFLGKHGGPKMEGQFAGTYDSAGNLTGTSRPLNIVGTGADAASQQYVTSLSQAFFTALQQYGGTTKGVTFGGGVVADPSGTSPTFVDTLVKSAAGQSLLALHNPNVGRSDAELQAELQLQSQRAILAALQDSQLPIRVADIFKGIDANTATADEITAAFTKANATQSAYTAAVAHYNDQFMTDAEKIAAAQTTVNDVFSKLGVAVPSTVDQFKALVKAAQAAGDTKTEDALLGVADAFKFVQDASKAAADQLKSDWESMQSDIDKITGRDRNPAQLQSLVSQFESGNAWSQGQSVQQLVTAFTSITQEDFGKYSAADQELIKAILALAASMGIVTKTVQELYQPPPPSTQTLEQQFQTQYSGVIGAQPDEMSKLSLEVKLMQDQVASWQARAQIVAATQGYYSQEYINLQEAINAFTTQIGAVTNAFGVTTSSGLVGQIAQLTILVSQYGEQKAEQLLALQQWYDAQKALIGENSTALDALKDIFQQKWDDIINGVANSSALDSAKQKLADWWHGMFLNQTLSPLSPQDKLAEARAQYESTLALAQGGDANAIGNLSGAADTYLQLARQIFASSNIYTAIFRDVMQATGGLAGITQSEINMKLFGVLPTSGTLATSGDIAALMASVNDLITLFTTEGANVSDPKLADAVDNLASTIKSTSSSGALT